MENKVGGFSRKAGSLKCLAAQPRLSRLHTIRADGQKEIQASARTATTKTNAFTLQSSPTAPACAWPREGLAQTGGRALEAPGVVESAVTWLQNLFREDDLPADVRELALFSDGPGCGKEEEDHGWANLWRHQGLKF